MKNFKYLFQFSLMCLIISCEPVSSVAINGKKKLMLKEEIGCNVKFIVENCQYSIFRFFLLNKRSHIELINVRSFMEPLSSYNDAFSSFFPCYMDRDTISMDDRGRPLFSSQLKDHTERKKDIEFITIPNRF
ncbi:hypothetical protein L1283_001797 [Sphingobacterium sp. HSC-15S19]